jgi:hypothetical protein
MAQVEIYKIKKTADPEIKNQGMFEFFGMGQSSGTVRSTPKFASLVTTTTRTSSAFPSYSTVSKSSRPDLPRGQYFL